MIFFLSVLPLFGVGQHWWTIISSFLLICGQFCSSPKITSFLGEWTPRYTVTVGAIKVNIRICITWKCMVSKWCKENSSFQIAGSNLTKTLWWKFIVISYQDLLLLTWAMLSSKLYMSIIFWPESDPPPRSRAMVFMYFLYALRIYGLTNEWWLVVYSNYTWITDIWNSLKELRHRSCILK